MADKEPRRARRPSLATSSDTSLDYVASEWRLSSEHLRELERMAGQGLSLDTIAARLDYPKKTWDLMLTLSTEIDDAYRAGAARGVDVISAKALAMARGGDRDMVKFYLERFGGAQFRPQQQAPVVVIQGPAIDLDQTALEQRFARQRALIDGTAQELSADPQTDERPA